MGYSNKWEEEVKDKCIGCVPEVLKLMDEAKKEILEVTGAEEVKTTYHYITNEKPLKLNYLGVMDCKCVDCIPGELDLTDWTRSDIILKFECVECKIEFDCNTTSFKVLCNTAKKSGWKMKWLDSGYETTCKECLKCLQQ